MKKIMQQNGILGRIEDFLDVPRNLRLTLGIGIGLFFSIAFSWMVSFSLEGKIYFGVLYFLLIFTFAMVIPYGILNEVNRKNTGYIDHIFQDTILFILLLIVIGLGWFSIQIIEKYID